MDMCFCSIQPFSETRTFTTHSKSDLSRIWEATIQLMRTSFSLLSAEKKTQNRYSFADTSFRIVLSLEFYLGTVLWFRFGLAPVLAYLGLTESRAANIDWMGTLVLGFSHTVAFCFGNFLFQDYGRRGFDKKPEHAFIKYYSIYGSIFVIGRMASQVLCSLRSESMNTHILQGKQMDGIRVELLPFCPR